MKTYILTTTNSLIRDWFTYRIQSLKNLMLDHSIFVANLVHCDSKDAGHWKPVYL